MLVTTIVYGILVGVISGFLWGTAFGAPAGAALIAGGIIGAVFGIFLGLFGKMSTAGGNVTSGEAMFVSGSILTMIAVIAIGSGLLALAVRFIFF